MAPAPASSGPVLGAGGLVLVPAHLAGLTAEQREDLRLWHGRVSLLERIKAMRGHTLLTIAATGLGMAGFAVGVDGAPPMVLSPLVPAYMSFHLWKRGKSLRRSGLRLRRVLLMPRAKWVIPVPRPIAERELERLAPRDVREGSHGIAIRRAVEERATIGGILRGLSRADRALVPDVEPAVSALVERVAHLAQLLHRLDHSFDPRASEELDARIAIAERRECTPEGERHLSLLRRQRATLTELAQRRAELARQLESAGLALGNLRLDLIRIRSSDLQSALSDVTSATQQARALSGDIGALLEAVSEVNGR